MNLTIAVIAGRAEPRVDWIFCDLRAQCRPGDVIDLLVVYGCYERELPSCGRIEERGATFDLRHVRPKPTIWQGPHRVTRDNWWAKSSAANTALALARHEHVAFLDDCCHLAPTWLEAVRRGAGKRTVLAGSYAKIERGQVTRDTRLELAPHGKVDCGGAWLYGGTFALPLAYALEVNGFEEGCDGMGGEDCIFGLMLANAGHRIDFEPALAIVQERPDVSDGSGGAFPRRASRERSLAAIERFGARKRTELTPNLVQLRAELARGGSFPVPSPAIDWRDWHGDGELVRDMPSPKPA